MTSSKKSPPPTQPELRKSEFADAILPDKLDPAFLMQYLHPDVHMSFKTVRAMAGCAVICALDHKASREFMASVLEHVLDLHVTSIQAEALIRVSNAMQRAEGIEPSEGNAPLEELIQPTLQKVMSLKSALFQELCHIAEIPPVGTTLS